MIAGNYLGNDIYASFDGNEIILTQNDGETVSTITFGLDVFRMLKTYANNKFKINEDDDCPDE